MILRLKPAAPKPPVTQCDEPYDDSNDADHYKLNRRKKLTRSGKDPMKCRNPAVYKLGSKCYCTPHAGRRILALVEDGTIELVGDLP